MISPSVVKNETSHRSSERGNVLFLILIAVALFAALSYAVTSSTRSSSNDGSKETNLISSAQITQFPAGVSNSVVRMVIAGISVDEIRFNTPENFDDLDTPFVGVFHPNGGGAVYIAAPPDIMADGNAGQWRFNGELEIPHIGTSGVGGNDIIAFLPGIKQSICRKINEEHGLGSTIPVLNGNRSAQYNMNMVDQGATDYTLPTTDVPDIDNGSGAFNGQPFGCFQNGGGNGEYVYYHVVVER